MHQVEGLAGSKIAVEDSHADEVDCFAGDDRAEAGVAQGLVAATTTDIDALIEWGRRYEHRPDARLNALISFLDAICRPDGRTFTNERVVVFTEYAATLDWIARVLTQRGYRDVLATSAEQANVELGVLIDDRNLTEAVEREMLNAADLLYERV